ncbi:MAG: HD-GYP domain-containing protein [Candidatus Cloacimonetes bacterium]|nr:HD-GYP domain-containing protein [Candidatus Cloacimonadota bacterium]
MTTQKDGLLIVPIIDATPGMKLGSPAYNRNGVKMLDAGTVIKSSSQLERLIGQGVQRLLIDTGDNAAPQQTPNRKTGTRSEPAPIRKSPQEFVSEMKKELVVAREVYKSASRVIENVMSDVRMGKHINNEAVKSTARDLVKSVLRNPHALLSIANLKRLDDYTFRHSVNVAAISVALANHLSFEPHLIEIIGIGGLMHDVGKARIPMHIINKAGSLTQEEFETVQHHPDYGVDICLSEHFDDSLILDIVRHHHEAYNGSGYPEGIDHTQISKFAAIVSIADFYDALTTVRSYKKKITPPEAISIVNSTSNIKFDRRLVFHFIKIIGIYPIGSVIKLASGRTAIIAGFYADDLLNPLIKVLITADHTLCRDDSTLPLKEMDDTIVELNTDFRLMGNIEDVL